jgi:hypothetical protein
MAGGCPDPGFFGLPPVVGAAAGAFAADDKLLTKTIARYGRGDLLCIDELGCAPRGADGSRGMRGPPPVLAGTG